MYKLSKHASVDRIERLYYLMETLGIGEEVCWSFSKAGQNRRQILTSTGVVLVLGEDECVITAYVATMKEATYIWHTSHPTRANQTMPQWLYTRVVHNRKYYRGNQQINAEYHYHSDEMKNHNFF